MGAWSRTRGGANKRGVATELVLTGRGRGHGAGAGPMEGRGKSRGVAAKLWAGQPCHGGRGHVDRGRSIAEMNESDGAEWSAAQPRGRAAQGPHRAQPAGSDGPPRAPPTPATAALCPTSYRPPSALPTPGSCTSWVSGPAPPASAPAPPSACRAPPRPGTIAAGAASPAG